MNTRDPRIDPRPGDVLKVASRAAVDQFAPHGCEPRAYLLRRVTYAAGKWNGWPDVVRYTDGVFDKHCRLSAWKRWAKNATVIHVDARNPEGATHD